MADSDIKLDHIQDVFGQMTSLKTYAIISLGFETEMGSDILVQKLCSASDQLVRHFAYLCGHVAHRASSTSKISLATVVPYGPGQRASLVVPKDCKTLSAPLKTMLQQRVPMTALDGHVFASHRPMPDSYNEKECLAPVFEIQANIVDGGVILTFQGNHHIMDMNGMSSIILLYAQALRGESFSASVVEYGNRDRRNIIQLLGPEDEKLDSSKLMKPRIYRDQPQGWIYFHVSNQSLSQLKSLTSTPDEDILRDQRPPWVSTDDVLTALIYTRVTAARLKRVKPTPKVTFCRAINARRVMGINQEYFGHLVWCVNTEVALDSPLATTDFIGLARRLRFDLNSVRPAEIQSFATALDALEDKGEMSCGASLNTNEGFDLVVSSWAGTRLSEALFGGFGKPVFCKRPNFGPVEGLVYIQPKTLEGHLEVALCLNTEDIQALQVDETFMHYAEYIG
ncbi:transferase family-domain-containing protein [Coniella lustricola]|uniref:Transferase family-domain-containing protein n=1 Tax=Coniella lustricola TaxID=2025994 RepID=A0A2T3AI49_9PEZI|nr:transferase family-domain-containing protein [Coniella lustricola]